MNRLNQIIFSKFVDEQKFNLTMKKILLIFPLLFIIFLFSSCQKDYNHLEGMIWNTTFHITYDGEKRLNDSIYEVLADIGKSLNVFDKESLVSRVNNSDSVRIDIYFRKVYEASKIINKISYGAFDPTLGPLIDAWGFGKGHKATTDTLRLDSLLAITGLEKTHISGDILYKENPSIRFNFSAIAKGYACDRIGEMLQRNGVNSFLVEIGGEIRCEGQSPSGTNWKISIDKPILSDSVLHESQCVISVTGAGIATSGNYRNFHESEGHTYGHTISSKTGRPIQTDVISATVVAFDAMMADGLATSMMALGSKKSAALADSIGVATLLVLSNGTTWQNQKFTDLTVSEP